MPQTRRARFGFLCEQRGCDSAEAFRNLEHYYDVELTYTSNAIEGNTLSPVETTLVIEHGVTISGKPLKDHLEALDHYDAIRYVRELAREKTPLDEGDVRNLRWSYSDPGPKLPASMPTWPLRSHGDWVT